MFLIKWLSEQKNPTKTNIGRDRILSIGCRLDCEKGAWHTGTEADLSVIGLTATSVYVIDIK